MTYRILYRGPLSSCNYGCWYCPFAKRAESHAELAGDRAALERFLSWVDTQRMHRFGVLFTPWGEALVRRWYQEGLVQLTQWPHIERAVIQTNLSCDLRWIERCERERLALWSTFHPGETSRERFVEQVRRVCDLGVRISVGVVGLHENFAEIEQLRAALPSSVYLWINAYKRTPDYYNLQDVQQLTEVDPLFPLNNQRHASLGAPCFAGETSFTVDGDGTMRRCHFVGEPLGNIHDANWEAALRPRPCPNETCGCHIGYVHLKPLELYDVFDGGVLERIPHSVAEQRRS